MNRNPEPPVDPVAGETVDWWRLPIVWLVIGGPLVVVIAATVTAVIAWRGADEVLDTRPQAGAATAVAEEPAIRARNHAATPR